MDWGIGTGNERKGHARVWRVGRGEEREEWQFVWGERVVEFTRVRRAWGAQNPQATLIIATHMSKP